MVPKPRRESWRKNLRDDALKFFPVYSYLMVYCPEATPLQIVSILNGLRDVDQLLRDGL